MTSLDQSVSTHPLFRTDHLMADLKGRSVRGGAITVSAQAVKFVLNIGSTAVLARLLTPADFGLVGMVATFTGFVALFKDLGLSMATVQRAEITHEQVSTLFWINVALSVLLMGVTAALAPAVAWFYGEPRLTAIMLVTAGTFVFGGLTAQHTAVIRRQMLFGILAKSEIISTLAGAGIGIALAYSGFRYWALVVVGLGTAIVNMLLVWWYCPWKPGVPSQGIGIKSMLRFGGKLTLAGVLNYIGSNFDNVMIGWWWGSSHLGMYTKAYGLLKLPLQQLNAPLAAVAVPAMSRTAGDARRYKHVYLRMAEQLVLLTGPAVAVMIVYADYVVQLLLGPQWTEAANIFAILGFGGFLLPIWNTIGWLFVSQGRVGEHLRFHSIDLVFKLCLILLGLHWGVMGVAVGVGARYYLILPLLFWMVGRKGPIRCSELYSMMLFPSVVTMMCFATLAMVRAGAQTVHPLGAIALGLAVACSTMATMLLVLPRGRRIARSLIDALRHLIYPNGVASVAN